MSMMLHGSAEQHIIAEGGREKFWGGAGTALSFFRLAAESK
jgi:hypothetical protein